MDNFGYTKRDLPQLYDNLTQHTTQMRKSLGDTRLLHFRHMEHFKKLIKIFEAEEEELIPQLTLQL